MDYASAQSGSIYAGQAVGGMPQSAPPDISPFHAMGSAVQNASDLCQRVRQLANRLTGEAPTPINEAGSGKIASGQPAVFHALRLTAEQLLTEVSEAQRALDRIERALP